MKTINQLCLVDDDEMFRFLTTKIIEQTNIVDIIKVFANGLEAITFLRSCIGEPSLLPDIILLDLSMPVMDGWEFLEEYIMMQPSLGKKIIIYVVSSSTAPVDVDRAHSISAVTDYLVKPITKDKFIEMMTKL